MIAAGVAVFRCSPMKVAQIEPWLGKEIKRQVLDFEASHATGWFRDCCNKKLRSSGNARCILRSSSGSFAISERDRGQGKGTAPGLPEAPQLEKVEP
jgi:hypothetical protein